MSINRIQKLLFSEYCDFEDMVLVESPFAQTTREGKGIRQVHLGLTPTKLVLAADVLPPVNVSNINYLPGVDPDIETFELVAVYPIECVNLSVFHRRKRQSLKAHFCNDRILYFELGGFVKRNMFWNLWCERVKFLNPEDPGSSRSETSVATSTSNSTLYLLDTKKVVTEAGLQQLWYKFGYDGNLIAPKWCDRYLYMGKQLSEPPTNYAPRMNPPTVGEFLSKRKRFKHLRNSETSEQLLARQRGGSINRFGLGISENCKSGLFLQTVSRSEESISLQSLISEIDYGHLAENAVLTWESNANVQRNRHKRRYGIAPQPHFLYGFGPWSISQGDKFSVQMKRAVSAVRTRRQPAEPELRLAISKRQLVSSISCETLHLDNRIFISNVVFFWTPDYWYRPRSARDAYQELSEHLRKVRQSCQSRKGRRRRPLGFRRGVFCTERRSTAQSDFDTDDDGRIDKCRKNSTSRVTRIPYLLIWFILLFIEETSIEFLRRVLTLNIALTSWDFDSTTLACQLTIIDRDLFLKITPTELGVLVWKQASKSAPNIGAFEAFSHRVSCLVATEVLRDDTDKIRARLISRLINTAEKCHKLSNFQSCRSILSGLQSPAVYRLHKTWGYVRKRHATKYQSFECMCRLYRDPRLPTYQRVFSRKSQSSPYLPSLGDLFLRLLHSHSDTLYLESFPNSNTKSSMKSDPKSLRTLKKLLYTLRMLQTNSNTTISSICSDVSEMFDSRLVRLNRALEFLDKSQKAAQKYTMKGNELAGEYLLKARYREESENFLHSFSVEKSEFVFK
ncbi:hypothetical protein RI129_007963 [Pyrocoelia pectoralis]|uniref:Ras-GEF domain-containing protein n=1 Tax=Pyrocoelia pectoralis TaxID=417401 RepID=A0AAN7VF41_9COLE